MDTNIITLRDPKHVTDLRSSGILVTGVIRSTTLTIRDSAASRELDRSKRAEQGTTEVNKKLAAGVTSFRLLQNHRQTVNNGMKRFGYAFDHAMGGEQYYVPSVRLERLAKWEQQMLDEHQVLKDNFLKIWPDIRAEAAFRMGDLFNRDEFPTVDELLRKFTIKFYHSEVPVGDFRNVLFHEALGDTKAILQQDLNEQLEAMMQDQLAQVVKLIKSLSHCCDIDVVDDKKNGGKKTVRRKIYESTFENALEWINTIERCNPSGSVALAEVRGMLSSALQGVTVDTLKESDALRQKVKSGVDEIINKFQF